MIILPQLFEDESRRLFDRFGRINEWSDFLRSFSRPTSAGLRANSLKISPMDLFRLLRLDPNAFKSIPWADDGFYLPSDFHPGRLAWHSAGLYYVQEPSAMLPAAVLNAQPGERILDLCAAPGGKSARIAADLRGEGLLWANEISADRVRALLHNLERIGCRNSLITQETPERLAERLPDYFDGILVDAPCSGSGMFRRDPSAIESWLRYGSDHCTSLQRGILRAAWAMLRPGGRLVYSTCTFSIAENEEMIAWMLEEFPDCLILPIDKPESVDDGLPLTEAMVRTARIWPHRSNGDGHFCALLQKMAAKERLIIEVDEAVWEPIPIPPAKSEAAEAWRAFDAFLQKTLTDDRLREFQFEMEKGGLRFERDCLHLLPPNVRAPSGLRKVKTGLFLGQVRFLRNRSAVFEPSQAFLFSLTGQDLRQTEIGSPDSDLIRRYLRGETISQSESSDFCTGLFGAVLLGQEGESWPLGWFKTMPGGLLKNLYPQAWRRVL